MLVIPAQGSHAPSEEQHPNAHRYCHVRAVRYLTENGGEDVVGGVATRKKHQRAYAYGQSKQEGTRFALLRSWRDVGLQ